MDSVRLFEFYRGATAWPRTKSELSQTAERIAHLLESPFVAIHVAEDEEKFAYFLGPTVRNGMPPIGPELLEEMLRSQFRRSEELFSGNHGQNFEPGFTLESSLRQIQISRENSPLAHGLSLQHLTLVAIPRPPASGDLRNSQFFRQRREPGSLLVASFKALGTGGQILLLAAAQRLSELSAICRLEAAIQLRNQFLSIASHELKTPLTSIYGILQLQERLGKMKRGEAVPAISETNERQQSFLKILIRQVQRLNELIDGLLDVSRIQNGRFIVEPSETDVAVVLSDTVKSRLNLIAQEANISLQLDAPQSLIAWVDPVRIEEVITNLVMNAIRFSPEGGVVWIRLRDEEGSFRLTVRDQGPSVPGEDRERIFQPFERAQRTSRLGGLGLGLYISRQIAKLHGGNVSLVESIPGKGNVFEANFPRVDVKTVAGMSAALG